MTVVAEKDRTVAKINSYLRRCEAPARSRSQAPSALAVGGFGAVFAQVVVFAET
jgi:hypothetical protein